MLGMEEIKTLKNRIDELENKLKNEKYTYYYVLYLQVTHR